MLYVADSDLDAVAAARSKAFKAGWKRYGKLPAGLVANYQVGNFNVTAQEREIAGAPKKKRGRGRPGRTDEDKREDAKFLVNYETAACGEYEFANRLGVTMKQLRIRLARARMDRLRATRLTLTK
jgi:hypothetical protein